MASCRGGDDEHATAHSLFSATYVVCTLRSTFLRSGEARIAGSGAVSDSKHDNLGGLLKRPFITFMLIDGWLGHRPVPRGSLYRHSPVSSRSLACGPVA